MGCVRHRRLHSDSRPTSMVGTVTCHTYRPNRVYHRHVPASVCSWLGGCRVFCVDVLGVDAVSRFLNYDIKVRRPTSEQIAAATAEWEAKHGPVVTEPIRVTEDRCFYAADPDVLADARRRGGVAGSRHRQVKSAPASSDNSRR
jgi:hypothetical protein